MNTARKQRRAPVALPKFWRPKLAEGVKLDAKLIHHDLVHRLETGTATVSDMWDWMETGFTYSQMFRLLKEDGVELTEDAEAAIAAQLNSYGAICKRLRQWRKVQLTKAELETARVATQVFDGLIDLDRNGIAVAAAEWSMRQMAQLRKAMPG
ncbi:MAG: hypothetical protein LBJ15_18285 [Comamonas sp.]|jgi:hypothetical protein|uniref:hypothetical protein n=1 Tax=Comamonas sp. TaxID=34028 RepID=UPI00281BFC53|nr:hypothetical protein [Comamonas sp.]MDR0215926.1 hypothetical protein [Comamonas sp.]